MNKETIQEMRDCLQACLDTFEMLAEEQIAYIDNIPQWIKTLLKDPQ